MQGTLLQRLISGQNAFLQARHAVLTTNLANADSPDYQPLDVQKPDFAKLVDRSRRPGASLSMAQTDASHASGVALKPSEVGAREVDGFETAPSGNAVVLEEQAHKLQETRLAYELTTSIYSKYMRLMRTAIGGSGA